MGRGLVGTYWRKAEGWLQECLRRQVPSSLVGSGMVRIALPLTGCMTDTGGKTGDGRGDLW